MCGLLLLSVCGWGVSAALVSICALLKQETQHPRYCRRSHDGNSNAQACLMNLFMNSTLCNYAHIVHIVMQEHLVISVAGNSNVTAQKDILYYCCSFVGTDLERSTYKIRSNKIPLLSLRWNTQLSLTK